MNEQEITPELIREQVSIFYDDSLNWQQKVDASRYGKSWHGSPKEKAEAKRLFINDLIIAYDLRGKFLQGIAEYAWEEGHSAGLHEVQGTLEDILEYIERGQM